MDFYYNTMVASVASQTIVPITCSNLNLTWYDRFIRKAKILLSPDDFAITKERVRLFFILQSIGELKYLT